MINLKVYYDKLLNFLYQDTICPVCSIEGNGLCKKCKGELIYYGHTKIHDLEGYVLYFYKTTAEKLIYNFKKQCKFSSFHALVALLKDEEVRLGTDTYLRKINYSKIKSESLKEGFRPDFMVYVPSNKRNINIRGFDPGKLLAEEYSKIFNIKLLHCTLNLSKHENKTMNFSERFESSKKNLAIKPGYSKVLNNKNILVFDDILTTGASISGLAEKLKSEGVNEVKFFTLMKSTK